ncbi:hypothetical protein DL762_002645 [Monosporascus cannonballus]|uniref:FAD-binding PCMH-type domain-containing protein n=1 Tax=Monosporascus cannonballus TaxID=155416 RepID=A0ABY0HCY3_9PEZI|nr:hypothetical protein DL762_002645 [Monosporascus cannonballus]RYO92054.1 hypothetical protein DL763_004810 [Monosporascus cannonballus]
MMAIVDEEELVPSIIVYPGSTEEVRQVVLWANEYRIPIFPISMGRNFGYGGAAPRVRGSVVIDLGRRMDKILDISPEAYTCLLEPGVSYFALYNEIRARGYEDLWINVPDVGGGSVLGNAIDRGVGYTPYGDHWACHSGLEIVLPTGEVIRTGMGLYRGTTPGKPFHMASVLIQSGYESFMYTFPKEDNLDRDHQTASY